VVSVDHPLDEEVPFRPELVGEYLTTSSSCGSRRPSGSRRREAGNGHGEFRRHLDYARRLYLDCGKVYLRRQSTTKRPLNSPMRAFPSSIPSIRTSNCVPSLHVLLVVANWLRTRSLNASGGTHGAHTWAVRLAPWPTSGRRPSGSRRASFS
jgi:hypothetical protein